jgi:ribonucleotide monophosphatase NagD (HAD superfamily)
MDLGMTGILVRTGKYREAHYLASSRAADLVAADLAEVVSRVLGP